MVLLLTSREKRHNDYKLAHLVPGYGAVQRVGVFEVVGFFHLVDFVLDRESLLREGLVRDQNLQVLHHVTGRIYVYVLIVIPGGHR